MTEPLRESRPGGAVRVVEMGPGTGAVTRGIVKSRSPAWNVLAIVNASCISSSMLFVGFVFLLTHGVRLSEDTPKPKP